MKERIAVGISGGVDSMVCAKLLIDQGYDVFGATMYLFDEEVDGQLMPPDFLKDAKEVCDRLKIDHKIIDLRDVFKDQVIDPFIESYLRGETPNPCALCNPAIKYGAFLDAVLDLGASRLAIGHYANIVYDSEIEKYRIYQGKDPRKDQSFLLYGLSQRQLSKLILPLGDIEKKARVREAAQSIHLKIAQKKDSTDICFIPNGKYYDFIKKMRPGKVRRGNFVTREGTVLGQHRGIINYTIGQRRGLLPTLNKPMFVVEIKPETNEVVLGKDEETYSRGFIGEDFNFTIYDEIPLNRPLKVKICQWGYYLDCMIVKEGDTYKIKFDRPERAVAIGQAAVFHQGSEVVGGCLIKAVIK
jgi:tRNA-specific 2-thiouridylase